MRRSAFTVIELLIVIAVIGVLIAIILPLLLRARETENRVQCANNLRRIGQAILMYSNDAKGPYPRTRYDPASAMTPTWGTGSRAANPFAEGGPAPNDVSAALFLLLRTQDAPAKLFVCPSTDPEPWDFGGGRTALNWSNWEGTDGIRKHLSYSYRNPYPDPAAPKPDFRKTSGFPEGFAVVADMNPGGSSGNGALLASTSTSSARQMRGANSRNHDRDGQNVLFADGHVEFVSNPFCGVKRDNIYTRRRTESPHVGDSVIAAPADFDDSVMLPTD